MRRLLLLLAISASTVMHAQTVTVTAPKRPPSVTPPAKPRLSFAGRCASCTQEISGTISVDEEAVRFCCSSEAKSGATYSRRCALSVALPLTTVTRQYLETRGPTWHIVSHGADYAFVATDGPVLKEAFERVQRARSSIPSRLAETFEKEFAALVRPTLAAAECQ